MNIHLLMMRKRIALILIFCFLLVHILSIPSEMVKAKEMNPCEMYNFSSAFVRGTYEIAYKAGFFYFHIYNSNITNNTMYVLGYDNYEHRWYRVIAHSVIGGPRIGYIGKHECRIFAFGFLGVKVLGVNATSSIGYRN